MKDRCLVHRAICFTRDLSAGSHVSRVDRTPEQAVDEALHRADDSADVVASVTWRSIAIGEAES
jgi:hypothetical protein